MYLEFEGISFFLLIYLASNTLLLVLLCIIINVSILLGSIHIFQRLFTISYHTTSIITIIQYFYLFVCLLGSLNPNLKNVRIQDTCSYLCGLSLSKSHSKILLLLTVQFLKKHAINTRYRGKSLCLILSQFYTSWSCIIWHAALCQ